MAKVNITIDGCQMQVEDNLTVLEAAKQAGIEIPTLCYLNDLNKIGACRICLVEVQGARGLQASCSYPVSEGMVVRTNTKQVREARKSTLELLLSTHKKNCLSCSRNTDCELQALAEQMGVGEVIYDEDEMDDEIDNLSTSIAIGSLNNISINCSSSSFSSSLFLSNILTISFLPTLAIITPLHNNQ
jgi:NADH dehydrogenase/NADH:ubiquinone oxidoreductase subunit G